MNKVYDNGSVLLGEKYNIIQYCKRQLNKIGIDKDDREEIEKLLEEIKDYNNNDILTINYDFGMGLFIIDIWEDTDKVYDSAD